MAILLFAVGCDSGTPVRLRVEGLEGVVVVEGRSETTTARRAIEDDGDHDLGGFAEGDLVELAIVDQPDRPPQRCVLGASSAIAGATVSLRCERLEPCAAIFRPTAAPITTEPALEAFDRMGLSLMEVQPWPEDDARWLVTLREGALTRFDPRSGTTDLLLRIRERVEYGEDDGLLSAALHPRFPEVPWIYLLYVSEAVEGDPRSIRVVRFTWDPALEVFDPESELVLVNEPKTPDTNSHSGGAARFGPDGYLYASFGDGGFLLPPPDHAQNVSSLLGAMVRIDVDVPTDDPVGYRVVDDNPFAPGGEMAGAGRPEIFAWGLRNPFRFTIEPATGEIWLGDVGAAFWEEIDIVERGGNYGWSILEGPDCFVRPWGSESGVRDCVAPGTYDEPYYAYFHDGGAGASIVGGFVYHGAALPELEGAYVFADYVRRAVYALHAEGAEMEELATVDLPIVAVLPDRDGEPLIVGLQSVERLVPGPEVETVPVDIAATGCMDLDDPTAPSGAFDVYPVNAPLWSDGAVKTRYVLLPEGETIEVGDGGDLGFPVGSVLAKEFRIGGRLVETRFLARRDDGWTAVSYRWEGGTATLVDAPRTEAIDGQTWQFPGPGQCFHCHTDAAGVSLGPELGQLAGAEGGLAAWIERGWIDRSHAGATPLPSIDDEGAPLEARVRAYLHTNCSSCHRPDAGQRVALDLRADVPLSETGLCGIATADRFPASAHIVEPGDPDASALWLRISSDGAGRMPPLGSTVVDDVASGAVRRWIEGLAACP
ncbi:MAG: PQQ-dependent sugar dehydrogenase [Myxococcales bacterium]|nr:PQQ-dependent sugar dehydrogenase [Myxococcales bacterium]